MNWRAQTGLRSRFAHSNSNHSLIRAQLTNRRAGQITRRNATPRERSNREHNDEERPSPGTPRLLRAAMLLLVGTCLASLIVVCADGRLRPRLCGEGRGRAYPQSLGHEGRAAPASSHRLNRRSHIPRGTRPATTDDVTARRRPTRGAGRRIGCCACTPSADFAPRGSATLCPSSRAPACRHHPTAGRRE